MSREMIKLSLDDVKAHLTELKHDQIIAEGERSATKAISRKDATQQAASGNTDEIDKSLLVDTITR